MGGQTKKAAVETVKKQLRRSGVVLLLLSCAVSLSAQQRRVVPKHYTYVIVHGAWGGGWDWLAIDSMLTRRGHHVARVTLTGLGERHHLASPDIGLGTHIDDVVNKILWDNLHDVVLVGHSYGGMVITGVVDRIPDRIKRVVYLDALLPDSGESLMSIPDTARAKFIQSVTRDGYLVPVWVQDTTVIPRDVPQSLRTFTDTLRLVNPARLKVPAAYILTYEPQITPDPFQMFADRAAARGWPVYKMVSDHLPERTHRTELVTLLERVP
jgi:pimeloyl-ACP methyl ester carboxylesterase